MAYRQAFRKQFLEAARKALAETKEWEQAMGKVRQIQNPPPKVVAPMNVPMPIRLLPQSSEGIVAKLYKGLRRR
jgi:hypothetical protein